MSPPCKTNNQWPKIMFLRSHLLTTMLFPNLPPWPERLASCGMVYSNYGHHVLKTIRINLFTLEPSQLSIATCPGLILFDKFYTMTCLSISLLSWLKHFVPIPSSVRSYASSSRNTSSQGSGPHGSRRISVNRRTVHLPGTLVLPSAAHLPASKSAIDELDEYARWRPQTPPLQPMTKNQPRRKRSVFYSSDLSMLYPSAIYLLLGLVY